MTSAATNWLMGKEHPEVAIKVLNEKLSHCLEVMDMINNHLSHEHSSRLEWIIIILIAIEIVFEVIHLRLNYIDTQSETETVTDSNHSKQ